jgi:formamidopyrimidine-DNA glycosylase
MPELPEVESVRRGLLPWIVGAKIIKAELSLPRLLKYPKPASFQKSLTGSRIKALTRKGKYLIFELDNQKDLIIHLGMSGRLIPSAESEAYPPHTHLILQLEAQANLLFIDPRTFGRIALLPHEDYSQLPGLAAIGIDPTLPEEYQWEKVKDLFRGNRPVKSFLLDQSILAGIGNIYADESLFRAKIHPLRLVSSLTTREKKRLFTVIQDILNEAIECGGTTILTFMDSHKNHGNFQSHLQVYGKENSPCPHCSSLIHKITIAGRSAHFCPHCQK